MIRTRFAPSPTGHLHVGGARTAILNWLYARHAGGTFVLRLEDTDRERNVAGAEAMILEDLRWLGIDWDEGPDMGGPYGPYRQSERGAFYRDAAERLLAEGRAYVCHCPPTAATEGAPGHERCACAERAERVLPAEGEASVRFRVPAGEPVVVHDRVRGEVRFPRESIEDFVLLRSDGRATYNFAAVVDDAAMQITDVIRGADHLINTPKQLLIYEALGLEAPRFAHIPLILGEDRQKLSKRHGATSVGEHRRLGYMPEALVNYLSLLSWSSPSGEEVLPRERLIEEIDLSRVGASDAIFDREKLRWLSATYLRELSDEELAAQLRGFIDPERYPGLVDRSIAVAAALRNRISTLGDANEELEHFRAPHTPVQLAARAETLADPAARAVLAAVRARLAALEAWNSEVIKEAIRQGGADAGAKGKALFQPVRRALTGEDHGPDLPLVAAVLGREAALGLLAAGTDES